MNGNEDLLASHLLRIATSRKVPVVQVLRDLGLVENFHDAEIEGVSENANVTDAQQTLIV